MAALTVSDAARRAPVLVTRPGRLAVTARLLALPGPTSKRTFGAKARVTFPSGAVASVPVESLTLLQSHELETP